MSLLGTMSAGTGGAGAPTFGRPTVRSADRAVQHTVLYLAYFFPPRGGAAVQRSLKFAKYLPQFGWRPLVVANGGDTTVSDNATKVQDPTLLKELPQGAVVRYTALTPDEKQDYDRAQSKF